MALILTQYAHAQSKAAVVTGKNRVQAYIGVMEIDDQTGSLQTDSREPPANDPVEIDFANLFAIGIEVETPLRNRDSGLELGVNAGGGISWRGSDTEFTGKVDEGGGTVAFRIDNEMLVLEGHIGGYLRAHLGKSADVYLGAGPAIIFAEHDVDDDEIDADELSQTGSGTIIIGDDSASDVIIGFYARAGIEFNLDAGGQWGLGVRYLGGELDFDDTVGEFDLEGVQVLLTYSAWF
jgi:opacity protein-like surface antigen